MAAFLSLLRREYGSASDYLLAAGTAETTLERLREVLLEPVGAGGPPVGAGGGSHLFAPHFASWARN